MSPDFATIRGHRPSIFAQPVEAAAMLDRWLATTGKACDVLLQ